MTDQTSLLESEREGERVVIRLGGEIDLSNVESLEAQIERAIVNAEWVVIDLSAIEFIDSSGLRLLKRISTSTDGKAPLVVVAPPGSIARSVLDVSRMTDELAVQDAPG